MELYYPLILDGATGTQLQKRGMPVGVCSEEWVMHNPWAIKDIQAKYIEAGSNIVYAPTFSANSVKLEENNIFNEVHHYNRSLVSFSKEAAGGKAYVAGDIAPIGKFLTPMGDMSFEEMFDVYQEQAKALEEADVDLYVVETMMTIAEARAAVLAVRSVSRKPIFVTFTCDEKGKSLTGTDITAALMIMQGMEIDAFGLNCSVGPDDMLTQLKRLSLYNEVPLIAKPNAGMPQFKDGKAYYDCPSDEFAKYVSAFAQAGVAIYGGCCGTEPEHIKAIHETVKDVKITLPEPKNTDFLPLATEKEVFLLPRDVKIGTVLPCDENLAEALEAALEEDRPVIAIAIDSMDQLDDFADNQYALTKPLCIVTDDKAVLEEALKLYQGRAMYEGSLSEAELKALSGTYGLVY